MLRKRGLPYADVLGLSSALLNGTYIFEIILVVFDLRGMGFIDQIHAMAATVTLW